MCNRYGKGGEMRKGRKLGHVTCCGATEVRAEARLIGLVAAAVVVSSLGIADH